MEADGTDNDEWEMKRFQGWKRSCRYRVHQVPHYLMLTVQRIRTMSYNSD